MTTKGYHKKHENDADGYLVGAKDEDAKYSGPSLHVYTDDDWLHLWAGDYEEVFLNIEALPDLIAVLQALRRNP